MPVFSATRLILFALLAAIEQDMRELASTYVAELGTRPEEAFGEERAAELKERDRRTGENAGEPSCSELLRLSDFQDPIEVLNRCRHSLPDDLATYVRSLTSDVETMVPIRHRVMHHRPLQPGDLDIVGAFAGDNAKERPACWPETRQVISRIDKDPGFIYSLPMPADRATHRASFHNLPIPDFDETGFIGRQNDVRDLKKKILGPFPVHAIVGEGGVGKTALALKVAYELLDEDPMPFDQIVWATAKSTQIVGAEVRDILEAIRDSAGLIQAVATELSPVSTESAAEEVLDYLKTFKILIVLDNLETVFDQALIDFLGRIESESKVLITSRLGLGQMELRYKPEPLSPSEGASLLRTTAKVRGVSLLAKTPQDKLASYVARMGANPGYIKWFVAAVQAGTAPEDVLANPDRFLEFCLSNVYKYLGSASQTILGAYLSVPGRHTYAEIDALTRMPVDGIKEGIQQLLSTNMFTMQSQTSGTGTAYELAELAREYLTRHHAVEPSDDRKFQARWKEIAAAQDKMRRSRGESPYSLRSIDARSLGEAAVARHLVDAADAALADDLIEANALVERAQQLAVDYAEVYRIQAFVRVKSKDTAGARAAYERCLTLSPKSAASHRAYGVFLHKTMHDLEEAQAHLEKAHELDPSGLDPKLGLIDLYTDTRDFDLSRSMVRELSHLDSLSIFDGQRAAVLISRRLCDEAEMELESGQDRAGTSTLAELAHEMRRWPKYVITEHVLALMPRAARLCERLAAHALEDEVKNNAFGCQGRFEDELSAGQNARNCREDRSYSGLVKGVERNGNYAFLVGDYGIEVFLHRTHMRHPADWYHLLPGAEVTMRVKPGKEGWEAVDAQLA